MVSAIILMTLLGAVTAAIQKPLALIKSTIAKQTCTSVSIASTHDVFYVVMRYLEDQDITSKIRTIALTSPPSWILRSSNTIKGIGKGKHLAKIMGIWVYISLREKSSGTTTIQSITITKLGRSHKLFDTLLEVSAVKPVEEGNKTTILEVSSDGRKLIGRQAKANKGSVVLPAQSTEILYGAIDSFIQNEQWYLDRDVPYQMGILLHGPSGTGKTSLVKAVAAYLDKNIVICKGFHNLVYANKYYTDNDIISLEEVDTYGLSNRRLSLEEAEDVGDSEDTAFVENMGKLTLGSALSALDGILSHRGRIIIMTTNDIDALDASLIRPGRIDLILEVGNLVPETFYKMLDKFKYSYPEYSSTQTIKPNMSPAMLQGDLLLGQPIEFLLNKYTN